MSQNKVWTGVPSVKGSSEFTRMALLTFSLVGLQFTWGMEMTYCTPYLLDLGLTKSKTSLVWLAGPLSGMIMAPAVGAAADRCKSRWGRRRPFMIGGAVVLAICLLVLGWSKEIVEIFFGQETANGTTTIFLAVGSIYALDFAINAVQWSCRSLIVDTLPISKQQTGTAWAGRMIAIGHLIGYGVGALNMEAFVGDVIGDTQFKRLIVVAVIALLLSVGVTSWAVTERVLVSDATGEAESKTGPIGIFKDVRHSFIHMPSRMKAICRVQFWSWIGWFPFLFYSSEWIGEIYLEHGMDSKKPVHDRIAVIGRIGSTALILFSIVTLVSTIVLPFFIQSPDDDNREFTRRPPASLAPVIDKVVKKKPTLLTAWFWGHFVFAGTMLMAPLVTSAWLASLLIALCGVPWAMTIWAPHAFMGVEISRIGPSANSSRKRRAPANGYTNRPASGSSIDLEMSEDAGDTEASGNDSRSGVYLGILNLFVTLPQFIGSIISSVVFWIFDSGKGTSRSGAEPNEERDGYSGIGICLFIGALSALMAAKAARSLKQLL